MTGPTQPDAYADQLGQARRVVRDLSRPHDRAVHLHARVLTDALAEATATYWNRRAKAFEDAAPRPGDFTGQATPEALREASRRCRDAAAACRARASLETAGQPYDPIVVDLLGVRE